MALHTLLIDPEDVLYSCPNPHANLHAFLESLGLQARHPQVVQRAIRAAYFDVVHGRISREQYYDAILRFHGVPEANFAVGRVALLNDSLNVTGILGALEALELLQKNGVKLAVIMNTPHSSEEIGRLLERLGFRADFWEALIVSRETQQALPDPVMFEKALQATNSHGHEAAFVSATLANLPHINEYGLTTIAFRIQEEVPYVQHHIRSLNDLTRLFTES